jgi:hypothetical protein
LAFSYWFDLTLVSQLREDLLLYSSYLPLGVLNDLYLQAINEFSGAIAGEKEDFCKGSLTHTIFYFVIVLLYFIFACIFFYQKYKKLVPFIVVIFVGLLLSCFIMLSINGLFL